MSKGFLYDEGDELITRKEDAGGLPDTSEASAGDVLSLDSDKEPVWSAPSGGGGNVVLDISGEYTEVSFNEDTYMGKPISGTLTDYLSIIENGGGIVLKSTDNTPATFYRTPTVYNKATGFDAIVLFVFEGSSSYEYFIGYPEEHPNDLYFLKESGD